jgi:hypothetical protein
MEEVATRPPSSNSFFSTTLEPSRPATLPCNAIDPPDETGREQMNSLERKKPAPLLRSLGSQAQVIGGLSPKVMLNPFPDRSAQNAPWSTVNGALSGSLNPPR